MNKTLSQQSDHATTAEVGPTPAPESTVTRVLGQLSRYISLLSVAAMVLIVSLEVFLRYVLGSPTTWVTEYSSYLMLAIVFLGAPFVQQTGRNVDADLISGFLPSEPRHDLKMAMIWVELIVISIIGWKFLGFVHSEFVTGTRSWGLLATKLWVPQSIIATGYLLLGAATLAKIHDLSNARTKVQRLSVVVAWVGLAIALSLIAIKQIPFHPDDQQISIAVAVLCVALCLISDGLRSAVILAAVVLIGAALFAFSTDSDLSVKMIAFGLLLFFLLSLGVGIGFLLTAIGILGAVVWLPSPMVQPVAARAWETATNSTLTAIPAFVLFGAILVRSGISRDMFHAFQVIGGRVPGSIAHASIAASGLFAAVSGSSLATAATIGQVAGPEMLRHGYDRRLTYGVIAAGGTLGILIPPSIALLLYGSIVGVPATKLFLAGILPGLFLMGLFSLVVFGWVILRPGAAPVAQSTSLREKVIALRPILPFVVLIVIILSSLYMGIATPTEAGSIGALAAFVLTILRGQGSIALFRDAFEEAAVVTSFLLIVAVGAAQMGYVLDYVGAATGLVEYVGSMNLEPWAVFAGIVCMYLVLGMFIEPISMMLMTLPVVAPLAQGAGMDLLWFGIVLVLLIEIGLVTPPVGMILFVLKGVAVEGTTLGDIARGVIPFLVVILLAVVILYLVPSIVTILPSL